MRVLHSGPGISLLSDDGEKTPLGLIELLFLASVFLAPWDLGLFGTGFTAYDALLIPLTVLVLMWRRKLRPLPAGMIVSVCVFLVFALLSTFRAPEPVESMSEIAQFILIFFVQIPLILAVVDSRRMARFVIVVLLTAVFAEISVSMVFYRVQGAGRALLIDSSNPNRLGYLTAYLLPFALFMMFFLVRRRGYWTLIFVAPIFYLMVWGVAASGSRSAAVSTVVGAFVFLGFRHGGRINWRLGLRLLLVVTIVGSIGVWLYRSNFLPTMLSERIEATLVDQRSSMIDDRLDLAKAGWLAFLDSPLIGVGLNNFRYVAGQYVPGTHQVPHNLWIQFLAQVGLIGTMAFLALVTHWFVLLVRAQRKTRVPGFSEPIWAIVASFVAILTIYMFVPLMIQRAYWLIFGLGLAFVSSIPQKESSCLSVSA